MATVDDILRATLRIDLPSAVEAQLVFHYKVTAGTSTDYPAIAIGIDTQQDINFDDLRDDINTAVATIGIDVSEWDFVNNEFDGKASVGANSYDGSSAGEMISHGAAGLILFTTDELRRQGRKYLPGLTETGLSASIWSAALLADLVLAAASMADSFTADGLTLQPCTFNTDPLSARFETESLFAGTEFVSSFPGYQRRRRPGVGI